LQQTRGEDITKNQGRRFRQDNNKHEKKYKKRNKGEKRILLRSEHNQAMPFGIVVG
jgi:hypothetical protein